MHLRNEVTPSIGSSGNSCIDAGLENGFRLLRPFQPNQRASEGQVRSDMYWIQLDCDAKMFHGFFKAAAFLQNLVAETVTPKKSFWILGHHLAKCVNIHDECPKDGAS